MLRVKGYREAKPGVETKIKQEGRMTYLGNEQKVFQGFDIGDEHILEFLIQELCQ